MARGPQQCIYYVYLKRDFENVPRYVGKGHGERCYHHERLPKHWNRQMRALVEEAKRRGELLPTEFLAEGLAEADALELERHWIAHYGRGRKGPLYNWTDGGEGVSGHVHSPETRAKLSGRKRKPESHAKWLATVASHSPERRAATKEKQAAAKRGKKQAPEAVAKRAAKAKGRKPPPEVGRKISASKMGHEVTQETRDKISATKKANPRYMTDAEKQHLHDINVGRTFTPEQMERYKRTWDDPDIRERRRQGMLARWQDPELRERQRQSRIASWARRKAAKATT